MTFRVGQKVVCVNNAAKYGDWEKCIDVPVEGDIYTVSRAPFPAPVESDYGEGLTLIALAELRNPYGGYDASRFRPIVERKTDISIFTKMLTPEGVDA